MVVEASQRVSRAQKLVPVFKALADENRMAIFQLLRERCGSGCEVSKDGLDRTVGELAKDFDLALSTVSHHIKELRHAGLVICEKRGKQVHCRVNSTLLKDLEAFMREG